MKFKAVLILVLVNIVSSVCAQTYKRDLFLKNPRMNGEDVTSVQKKLLSLNINVVGEADGWFGPNTESGVKKFQQFVGFNSDGKVTKQLWNVLFSTDKQYQDIKNIIANLNNLDISKLDKIEEDYFDHSTEGGNIIRYKFNKETKYTEVYIFGETGKVSYYIYHLVNGYLAIRTLYSYPEMFDVEHATITVESYYLTTASNLRISNGVIENVDVKSLDFLDDYYFQ